MRHRPGLVALLLVASLMLLAACRSAQPTALPPTPEPTATPELEQVEPEEAAAGGPVLVATLDHEGVSVASIAFAPDGQMLASGLLNQVRLWNVADGALIRSIEHRHEGEDLAFAPDGATIAAGVTTPGVQLSSVSDGQMLHQLGRGYNNRVAFAPDGETLASGNREGKVWLWRVADGEQVDEWGVDDSGWLTALAYAPDGALVAAGHADGVVRLWRAADGALLHTLAPEGDYSRAAGLALAPDGQWLAVAGAQVGFDHVVRIWRTSDGAVQGELALASSSADSVAISADGRLLAAGGADGVRLWDTADWTLLHLLAPEGDAGERQQVTSVAFSPDGRWLAAGAKSGAVLLWQLASEG